MTHYDNIFTDDQRGRGSAAGNGDAAHLDTTRNRSRIPCQVLEVSSTILCLSRQIVLKITEENKNTFSRVAHKLAHDIRSNRLLTIQSLSLGLTIKLNFSNISKVTYYIDTHKCMLQKSKMMHIPGTSDIFGMWSSLKERLLSIA